MNSLPRFRWKIVFWKLFFWRHFLEFSWRLTTKFSETSTCIKQDYFLRALVYRTNVMSRNKWEYGKLKESTTNDVRTRARVREGCVGGPNCAGFHHSPAAGITFKSLLCVTIRDFHLFHRYEILQKFRLFCSQVWYLFFFFFPLFLVSLHCPLKILVMYGHESSIYWEWCDSF